MEENNKNTEKKEGKMSFAIFIVILLVIIVAGIVYIIISGETENEESQENKNTSVNTSKIANNNLAQNDNVENNEEGGTTGEESMKMQAFNIQFSPYAGTNLSASMIKSLLSIIISSNFINEVNDEPIVSVITEGEKFESDILFEEGTSKREDIEAISEKINEEETYTVELKYSEQGYVEFIDIR